MTWILASASPRRREMLQHLGLNFSVVCADAHESSEERDGGRLVEILAARKAAAVKNLLNEEGRLDDDTVILAADTVVVSPDGEILGKPHDADDARRMLRSLSGNTHRVISGICVVKGGQTVTAHEVTEVSFAPLSDDVIDAYIASGEPMDKAGAYGIQDTASLWIEGIRGDYFNVVGLPLHRMEVVLKENFELSLWGNM
ncbi:MAG: septum formation protein Maf [Ruminococcaceae bacterium]|nr:septum formation protein Maf [Oscillospiraceae bacterium]